MTGCACGDQWRIEAADLRTGTVRAVVHPLTFNFQTTLNRVGQGTLTFATREISVRDLWPHLSSVWITRIAGGNASPENPIVEFAGMPETFSASDNGTTNVGIKSIEKYLHHRNIGMNGRPGLDFRGQYQTRIGAALVEAAAENGIPLTAIADTSTWARDRAYPGFERKNIGEAIEELTDVIGGVDYELVHLRRNGRWSTQVIFRDHVGVDRDLVLQSDREGAGYGLDVDAQEHATYVDAIGSGEEEAQMTAHAEDDSGVYPRFDAAPAWKDVSIPSTLTDHAEGYIEGYRDPVAIPSMSVAGFDPDPMLLRNGDSVDVRVNYGAVTYNGRARIVATSWQVDPENAPTRTFDFSPLTRASESVLNQVPTDDGCEDC